MYIQECVGMEQNSEIFKQLKPDGNDLLSGMSNSDKIQIIALIKEYYIELRKRLKIDPNITFGLEIEFEDAKRKIIEEKIASLYPVLAGNNTGWPVVDDGSLHLGGEINSPVLTDSNSDACWEQLQEICAIVSENAYVLDNTGGHIHFGAQILGNNPIYWYRFAILWAAYENIAFRFLAGEFLSFRSKILEQAMPIAGDVIRNLERLQDRARMTGANYILKVLDAEENRKRAVNFTNISDVEPYKYNSVYEKCTVEFRSGNGTFAPVIWQNEVNVVAHMFMYAKSDRFDEELVLNRLAWMQREEICSNIRRYSYIYLNQALELSDLLFDTNLDKVYFLRQYIKSGEVSTKPLVRSKQFFK